MGKKAWQDLACWFKNKVWGGVCVGGITVLFCFFIYFFTFLAKVGEKNAFKLVCACFSSAFREWRSLWLEAHGDPGLVPVPSIQSRGGAVLSGDSRKKGPEAAKGSGFGAVDVSPVLQDSPGSWALSSGAQGRLRLRRDHVSSERRARDSLEGALWKEA